LFFWCSYTAPKGLEPYPLWASKTTTSCNIHEPHSSSGWAKHLMHVLEASYFNSDKNPVLNNDWENPTSIMVCLGVGNQWCSL
jgi:hypothetical protein